MGDYLAWRAKFGVVTPSTNTVVQPEYDDMRPAGVTNHLARIHIPDMRIESNEDFESLIARIDADLDNAIDRVMTCKPDHLILGISALSVWGGSVAAGAALKERMHRRAGAAIGVSHAAEAVPAALRAYGAGRRIAVVEPYYPTVEPRLGGVFRELGYDIVRYRHLKGRSPVTYTHLGARDMIEALKGIDGDDVEAIVQFGANLPMARIAGEAERWLGKPVVSVNVATYWHALRACGITDRIEGFTRLLTEF
ncbi:MAG TPA: IgiC [Alphaproteobacteria bacterium]